MKRGIALLMACLAVMLVSVSCTRVPAPTAPPLPSGTTFGDSFPFPAGGSVKLAYGPSLRPDQIARLDQLASNLLRPLADVFWTPKADITVVFDVVSRAGRHATQVLWEQRDRSGALKNAILKVELNGLGAANEDPFTQSWLPGVFIQQMTYVLQTELPHAGVSWYRDGTADATGLILLEEGWSTYPGGLGSCVVDEEWAVPLYLNAHARGDGAGLYRGWLLLAAYDRTIIRSVNERLYAEAGIVGESQLRQAILAELGDEAVLDGLSAGEWLDRVGFRDGLRPIRDGDYLSWSVTEESGWSPNWLQAGLVAKSGTLVHRIRQATYGYRITDAFLGSLIAEGTASGVQEARFRFEPGAFDLSVWDLELTGSVGGTVTARKVVVPHLLSGNDSRKAIVVVDALNTVIREDGTLELMAGSSIATVAIDDGVAYFETESSPEFSRAIAIVRLSGGRTASFDNLLSLPHIGRQWVLVVP